MVKLAIVLPRNMHFGPQAATAVDLCVRDFVRFSAHRNTTAIFAAPVARPFPDLDVRPVPEGATSRTLAGIRDFAPDAVLVQQHRPTAAILAHRLRVPVLLHRHNLQKAPRGILRRWHLMRDYRALAGVVTASQSIADDLAIALPGYRGPVTTVHNGLDVQGWTPARERSRTVLFVGRLAPEKGVLEAALATVAALEQPAAAGWRAVFLLGEPDVHPSYAAEVRQVLAGLGGRAEVKERARHEVVQAAFESAAIALVPSLWPEPFGRTALEALAGGAALITSGTGGLSEVVGPPDAGAAIIVPNASEQTLAAQITGLIQDIPLAYRIGAVGRSRAEALFDIRPLAARLDMIVEKAAR